MKRPPKDDPRLSKGLQLLENKIAILSDLSDRTDAQVKQLTSLIDQKGRYIQDKIQVVEDHLKRVNESIEKSVEVSRIFESENPHKEYAERQNVSKYVQAARLANKGFTAQQISEKIDLPISELEFIVKVNKEKLMFANDMVPAWIENEEMFEVKETISPQKKDLSGLFEAPKVNVAANQKLVDDLKKAVVEAKEKWTTQHEETQSNSGLKAAFEIADNAKQKIVKAYNFKRIDSGKEIIK